MADLSAAVAIALSTRGTRKPTPQRVGFRALGEPEERPTEGAFRALGQPGERPTKGEFRALKES